MSIIGNNIKKIRSVKKLNQQAFADMFDLKRASVGAYEEGRADPKIKTIIEIANKFGISLDMFMKKELKINDLYRFDLFREDLTKGTVHNLTPQKAPVALVPIPYLSIEESHEYFIEKDDAKRSAQLPSIQLPIKTGGNYRAFEINDHMMSLQTGGLIQGDIFIGEATDSNEPSQLEVGKSYLFEFKEDYRLRKVVAKTMSQISLAGTHPDAYIENHNPKEITRIWKGVQIISKNISSGENNQNELNLLKEEIRLLKLKSK